MNAISSHPSSLDNSAIDAFRGKVTGPVLLPGESGYDEVRHVWNAMIDRHPTLIARCTSAADVAAAIAFARQHGLPLTIKGGGHGVSGKAVCDGGLMIDLSLMQGIEIDASRKVARVQGGVTWGALDAAAQAYGLATTGGIVASTGVAGLTLGGGLGFLMRRFGLSCDNLLAAEVVTAAGETLLASDDDHPDLFWALRGGGGNFGVVTAMTFRLHEVGPILGGFIVYPLTDAAAVIRHYRELTANAPETLTTYLSFAPGSDGLPAMTFTVCASGSREEREASIQRLRAFGEPIADTVAPITYGQMQTLLAEHYPAGRLHYWKSSFLDGISDEAIDCMVARFAAAPTSNVDLHLEHLGGAVARVSPTATAFAERTAAYTLLITAGWIDPTVADNSVRWVRETWEALQPYARASVYTNYVDAGEDDRAKAAYGENHARLAALKAIYDPDNCFNANLNIRPHS